MIFEKGSRKFCTCRRFSIFMVSGFLSLVGWELGKSTMWRTLSHSVRLPGKEEVFLLTGIASKIRFSMSSNRKKFVLINWVVKPDGKILAWGHVWHPRAMTECQIFSRLFRPNSVKKHFIIWPLYVKIPKILFRPELDAIDGALRTTTKAEFSILPQGLDGGWGGL